MGKTTIAITVAASLCSGILGFLVGGNTQPTASGANRDDQERRKANSNVRFNNSDGTANSPDRPRGKGRTLWSNSGTGTSDLHAIISKSLQPMTGRRDWIDHAIAIDSIPAGQIPEALAILEKSKQGGWSRRGAIGMLLANWADEDTPAALEYAESLTSNIDRKSAINAVLGSWAETDPLAADAWMRENIEPAKQGEYINSIITSMARTDPAKALDYYLTTIQSHPRQEWTLTSVFRQWAALDPETAATRALSLPAGFRKQAMGAIAASWVTQDEEGAINWMRSLPAGQMKSTVLTNLITHLAQSDTDKAITLMEDLTNRDDRRNMVHQLASILSRNDVSQALKWAESLEPSLQGDAIRNVVTQWGAIDPKKAMAYAESIESHSTRESTISSAATAWMRSDPDGCFAWLGTLDNAKSVKLLSNLSYSIPTDRIDGTLGLLTALPDNNNRNQAVRNLLNRWSDRDPEAALQWIINAPDDSSQKAGIDSVVRKIAADDPGRAIQVALQLTNEEARNKGTKAALTTWANYEPAKAARWAAALPAEEKLQKETLPSIIERWARNDSYAASAFLETLPAGNVRDISVERFANQVRREDPEAAVLWADTISDENRRNSTVSRSAQQWLKQDPNAARAWVQQSSLTDKQKDRLLKKAN